jgi:hypothetical protein
MMRVYEGRQTGKYRLNLMKIPAVFYFAAGTRAVRQIQTIGKT